MYRKIDANGFPTLFSIVKRALGGTDAQYVRETKLVAKPATRKIEAHCVLGVPTLAADTLPSGSLTYTGFAFAGKAISATIEYDLGESTATSTVSVSTERLLTTLTLIGREITPSGLSATRTNLGTYTGTASLQGLSNLGSFKGFSGNLLSSTGGFAGNTGGSFFGPQGIELGYAFVGTTTVSGINFQFGGTVIARR